MTKKMKHKTVKTPVELVKKGDPTGKIIAWACGVCGLVLPKDLAETHCAKRFCDCGVEIKGRTAWLACDACRNKKDQERLEHRKAKAELVDIKDCSEGMVYWEENDEYYNDIDEALEDCRDDEEYEEGEENDQTFWECSPYSLTLDARSIIESALESQEHHEDAWESVGGETELEELLTKWNKEYGSQTVSWATTNKLIVLEKED